MPSRLPLALACLCSLASSVNAAVVFGALTDVELNEGNILQTTNNGVTVRAGASGSVPAGGRNALLLFQLPDFGAVENPFLSADFGLNLATITGTPAYNVDLYGLGIQSTSTVAIGSGVLSTPRFYESDAVDPNATLIQLDFTVPTTPAANNVGFKNTNETGDQNLLDFLNAMYATGSGANQYVVFRLSPDTNLNNATVGYNYNSADAAGTATDPVLTYTAVPEPASFVALASGLGLLALRRRRA